MLEETHDRDQIIQRVAAAGVGKAELTCCVRVPGQAGTGRRQEVRAYQTMTAGGWCWSSGYRSWA